MTFNVSNYIISRSANRFGGDQDAYLKQAGIAIQQATQDIQSAVERQGDLIELFHQVVANLAKARQEIALKAKDKNGSLFGRRRDGDFGFESIETTVLYDVYAEYRDQHIAKIQSALASIPRNLGTFLVSGKKFEESPTLGRAFSTEYAFLNNDNKDKWLFPDTYESFKRLCELAQTPAPTKESFSDQCYVQLSVNKKAMQNLKKASIQEYNRFTLFPNIIFAEKAAGKEMHYYIKITRRLQVDGKMYSLGHALTTTHINNQSDLIKNMSDRPVIVLAHMDSFLIEVMMNDMAKVFKEAVECPSEDLISLKGRIALLKYEFAHTMPFARGSAAIGEWLETALYNVHGYEVQYNHNKMSDLEALTSSLSEYVATYESIATVTKSALPTIE